MYDIFSNKCNLNLIYLDLNRDEYSREGSEWDPSNARQSIPRAGPVPPLDLTEITKEKVDTSDTESWEFIELDSERYRTSKASVDMWNEYLEKYENEVKATRVINGSHKTAEGSQAEYRNECKYSDTDTELECTPAEQLTESNKGLMHGKPKERCAERGYKEANYKHEKMKLFQKYEAQARLAVKNKEKMSEDDVADVGEMRKRSAEGNPNNTKPMEGSDTVTTLGSERGNCTINDEIEERMYEGIPYIDEDVTVEPGTMTYSMDTSTMKEADTDK